mmetsp:Transcript_78361/g.253833  ORF Transcript_78361/g.253833 Transcript_78361/m.253833 type:complete len:238 (+) Transcript_78361:211-924(+)
MPSLPTPTTTRMSARRATSLAAGSAPRPMSAPSALTTSGWNSAAGSAPMSGTTARCTVCTRRRRWSRCWRCWCRSSLQSWTTATASAAVCPRRTCQPRTWRRRQRKKAAMGSFCRTSAGRPSAARWWRRRRACPTEAAAGTSQPSKTPRCGPSPRASGTASAARSRIWRSPGTPCPTLWESPAPRAAGTSSEDPCLPAPSRSSGGYPSGRTCARASSRASACRSSTSGSTSCSSTAP